MNLKSTLTVVIIEDEPDSCLLWKSFLTQLKYTVFTALTLREGLTLLESVQPDVIFLDNNLPDGLGWDHLDEICERHPKCKIHLVSAYEFDAARFERENVTVHNKPLTLANIRQLLS